MKIAILFILACALHAQQPLTDTSGTYQGYAAGLYENRSNQPPADHTAVGLSAAAAIVPRDGVGNPSAAGKIVLLSIGISNAFLEWCGPSSPCIPQSFTALARADSRVNNAQLVILNGASPGQFADTWISPTQTNYTRVLNNVLAPAGVTERQVQAVWLKVANNAPTTPLPSENSDAHRMLNYLGQIARALRVRYPNLKQVFVSSRIYAGYSTTNYSPEPFTYEYGWSVKWLIQAQIVQMRSGAVNIGAGDLSPAVAPWLAWGPYVWANGATPNPDGLTWLQSDYMTDRIHPTEAGAGKVGTRLLSFFLGDPATPWFRAGVVVPPPPPPPPTNNPTRTDIQNWLDQAMALIQQARTAIGSVQ